MHRATVSGSSTVLLTLLCLLAAACNVDRRPAGDWRLAKDDAETGDAPDSPDTSPPADTLETEPTVPPPGSDAGRIDAGPGRCGAKPICSAGGCRLDIQAPPLARIDFPIDWGGIPKGERDAVIIVAPSDAHLEDFDKEKYYPRIQVDDGTADEIVLPEKSFDIYWKSPRRERRVQKIQDDVVVDSDHSIRLEPDRLPTATLTGNLTLKGEPLEHWSDEPPGNADAHWTVTVIDQESGFRTEKKIPATKERYSLDLTPSTYDIRVGFWCWSEEGGPCGNKRRAIGSGSDSPRTVATDRLVAGPTNVDVDLQMVTFEVNPDTESLEQRADPETEWIVRFEETTTGAHFVRPVDLTAESQTLWGYPGTYDIWLQPLEQDAHRQEPDWKIGESIPVASDVAIPSQAPLPLSAELVPWDVHLTLNGQPISEWADERGIKDRLAWRVALVPNRPGPTWPNPWLAQFSARTSNGEIWMPPGSYEVYASFDPLDEIDLRGFPRAGAANVEREGTYTIALSTHSVTVEAKLTQPPPRLAHPNMKGDWSLRLRPNGSIDWTSFTLGVSRGSHRSIDMLEGDYRVDGSHDGGYPLPVSIPQNHNYRTFSYNGIWSPSDGDLTVTVPRRFLTGQISDPDRRYNEFKWNHLRLSPVDGGPDVYRTIEEAENTYTIDVPPGTYDIYLAPGMVQEHQSIGNAPNDRGRPLDWQIAECVRLPER